MSSRDRLKLKVLLWHVVKNITEPVVIAEHYNKITITIFGRRIQGS